MGNWMNKRTAGLLFWVVFSVIMVLVMPDLDELVREKGQVKIPESAQSEKAAAILSKMEDAGEETYQYIALFNRKEQLTNNNLQEIEEVIDTLREREQELGITSILAFSDSEETKKQLAADDGTTVLAQISINKSQGTVEEVAQSLRDIIRVEGVDTYLTGSDLVVDDFSKSTQEGVKKTEVIAIIFIIVVLILVFRSPIVPIISLITVGVSYIVSLGLVALLVDNFNLPFSNFTQVFLVVILFGIGTDYNILLFTRFKEEMVHQDNVMKAIQVTYKTAGKTVVYSGLAVFIGFLALMFADFKPYQATSLVAIGIGTLLLVLLTLNPFFMGVFGLKMFWPVKKVNGHPDNKLWGFLAKNSFFRPISAIVIVLAICTPLILKYSGDLNYNDLVEIDDSYESKQAIGIIENHFLPGFSAPMNVVIQAKEPLDNQKSLQDLDALTSSIAEIEGVAEVYSVTRPTSERIEELYLTKQSEELNTGIGEAKGGVEEINEGLSEAEGKLANSDGKGAEEVQQLIDGTASMQTGVGQLQDAINQLTAGFQNGSQGAAQLQEGLSSLKSNVAQLREAATQLQGGYQQLETGFGAFTDYFSTVSSAVTGAKQGYIQIQQSLLALQQSNDEVEQDANFQTALGTAKAGLEQLNGFESQLGGIGPQYEQAVASLEKANDSLAQLVGGLSKLEEGIDTLQAGANELSTGLQTGASGSAQISEKTKEMQTGLTAINNGQKELQTGLNNLQSQITVLQDGLAKSTGGLDEISNGLQDVQSYLGGLSTSEAGILFIPEEVLAGEEFEESLDMYMSEDRTTTSMRVILRVNPYSKEAIQIARDIDEQVKGFVKGTSLKDAIVAIGGKSMQNADLQDISKSDFIRSALVMLVGIGIVLILVTRSLFQSIIIIISLLLTTFASLGVSEFVTKYIIGQDLLGWNVPFFSFIMIVALGVDYSIFLMMRYREQAAESSESIIDAARHMGGVVLSAALILGGTFAALIPSGIQSLIQVSTVVMMGIAFLSFIMMPVFIPAVLGLSHKLGRLVNRKK